MRIQNLNSSKNSFNYWAGPLEKQVLVKRGDLLLAWSGTPGTSFGAHIWLGSDAVLNQHIFRCDLELSAITPEWARFAVNLRLNRLIGLAHGGVGLKHVTRGAIEELHIPLPPLSEQARITAIVAKADALRAKRRAALAQLDTLTQSIFLDMFGDPAANPRQWPLRSVSEYVAAFEGGKSIEAEAGDNVVTKNRVLKISAVTGMRFLAQESKPVPDSYVPPQEHFVRRGDLLFSRANTSELVGAVAYVDGAPQNVLLPDKLWRFVWRMSCAVEPLFVWALFQTKAVRHEIARRATGTSGSMKNISQEKLLGIRTIFPPIDLQRRFAERFAVARRARNAATSSASELDALIASLQHRAFRGEL